MFQVTFQKNLIGLEDLLVGVGSVTQTRGISDVSVTKINGANFPYDADDSMADKIDSLQAQMDSLPNVVDQDGNLLTGLVDTSASDISGTHSGRLWHKSVTAELAKLYYGSDFLFNYNPTDGDILTDYVAAQNATSTTSLTIGTGTKVFTTEPNKLFIPGSLCTIVSDADNNDYMSGTVTSYTGTTLTIDVTDTGGSGTLADWSISSSIAPAGVGDMLYSNNLASLASASISRTNLGVEIGADVQAYSALLDAHTALSDISGTIEKTGADTVGVYTVTAAGKAILDDADAGEQRTTLGLGTSAILDVGTSANNIVQLNGSAQLPAVDGSLLTNLPSAGILLQSKWKSYAAWTNIPGAIARDDSIPQVTEGTQILSNTIAQTVAGNRIRVTVKVPINNAATAVNHMVAALFVDGGANAIAMDYWTSGATHERSTLSFNIEYSEGDTSTHTFTVRVGSSASSCYINGYSSSRVYGGKLRATMLLEEIAA